MVTAIKVSKYGMRATAVLLTGTILSGLPATAIAQTAPAAAATPAPTPAPAQKAAPAAGGPQAQVPSVPTVAPPVIRTIKSLRVEGSERIEAETVLSYTKLRLGQGYTGETLDQAIRDLYASDLFADVQITGAQTGDIVFKIRENPIINRVIFEGNKVIKQDKIEKEVKLKPRQIFTRTAVREDISHILELYRRQGRFAATVNPQMVTLDQNRVDVIFEINEGPKSKVRQINIIGNEVFSDKKLRAQMATKVSSLSHLLSSNTSYDQDRMAYDQQKLRQFYLTEGYADFRVTSAVAELTPDKRDFIITYVVEEGKRYHFGDVTVDSDIRDFDNTKLAAGLPFKKGDWYNAKQVEDSVDHLNETAGLFGYAFTDTDPEFDRDPDKLTMGINFHIGEKQRSYIERIDINGNVNTQDKVVRREIRLAEGDAFNGFQIKRSQDRINSLGFFQDKFEIKQTPGSSPDRVVLEANVQEKPTGELQLSAGYSSLEGFIVQGSITQHNFRGKGQELRLSADWSTYSKSADLGFTEPYLFDKNIALGGDIFRRDYNAFNFVGDSRDTTYSDVSTGFQIRAGIPLTEYWSLATRYQLAFENVGLDQATYYTNGACDPLKAGRYLCEAIGNRVSSSVGYSIIFDSLNNRLHPTGGQKLSFSQDFAGVGGDVRYIRTRFEASKFWDIGHSGFILSLNAEGGIITPWGEGKQAPGVDSIFINDRFFLGEPDFRGFDIRGVGPRELRIPYTTDSAGHQVLDTNKDDITDDALGGHYYYLGRIEMEIPLGNGARELGLRPSIYIQAGALFGLKKPLPTQAFPTKTDPLTGQTVVLPIIQNQIDPTTGKQLYIVPVTDPTNPGALTTCVTGFASTAGGMCAGDSINSAYTNTISPFKEEYLGDSPRPRVSVGAGVNWNSPFGPLRIDVAYALLHNTGDDTKLLTYNVGTQF
jgi:outer membrane protein insertion porin family